MPSVSLADALTFMVAGVVYDAPLSGAVSDTEGGLLGADATAVTLTFENVAVDRRRGDRLVTTSPTYARRFR